MNGDDEGPRWNQDPVLWSPAHQRALVRKANALYFRQGAWNQTHWMGHQVVKCPTDLWAYQELLWSVRPDVLIETGTYAGGSALFFAHIFDLLGAGEVWTIDVVDAPDRPLHPRIHYVHGDSTDAEVVRRVRARCGSAERVMVILDSAHREAHVSEELHLYADLVTRGSYLVVEDTAFDGWPTWPEHGPGPAAAVRSFLKARDDFLVDPGPAKHLLTLAPGGFLRRV